MHRSPPSVINAHNFRILFYYEIKWKICVDRRIVFEISLKIINEHLMNLFGQKEISREATIRNFRIVQKEGPREVDGNGD